MLIRKIKIKHLKGDAEAFLIQRGFQKAFVTKVPDGFFVNITAEMQKAENLPRKANRTKIIYTNVKDGKKKVPNNFFEKITSGVINSGVVKLPQHIAECFK
jgi:hypothetical protein